MERSVNNTWTKSRRGQQKHYFGMTGSARVRVFSLMLAMTLLTACGPAIVKTEQPTQPANDILVLTGAGMVASSSNDPRYEETWLKVVKRYSQSLHTAMAGAGLNAQLHIKENGAESPKAVLGRLVAESKKDGLIQVTVTHIRNSEENTVYLNAEFLPLAYEHLSDGTQRVVPQPGTVKHYPLASTTKKDLRDASISGLAEMFVQELREQGYLSR